MHVTRSVSATMTTVWWIIVVLTIVTTSPPAISGGARLYETSAGDIALASAGYVARAQDSSTVYSNPAGMCLLEPGSDFLVSLQPLYGDVAFTSNPRQPSTARTAGTRSACFRASARSTPAEAND